MHMKSKLFYIAISCGIVSAGILSALLVRHLLATEKTEVFFAEEVRIDTAGYPFLGNEKAEISGVVCFDLMCHYCDSLRLTVDSLIEKYGDHIKMYDKPYALLNKHSNVLTRALLASKKQDSYFEMRDALFLLAARNRKAGRGKLQKRILETAVKLKLDPDRLQGDMDSKEIRLLLRKSTEEAKKYGINSIPMVYLQGHRIRGFNSFDRYARYIDHFISAGNMRDSSVSAAAETTIKDGSDGNAD